MKAYIPYFLWGGLFILTVIIEIASVQLISIWFAAGALAAFFAACLGASIPAQVVWFVAVSVLLLAFTRPIVKRIFSFGIRDTNTQEIGRTALVIQAIDPALGTGRVRIDGTDWMAVSQTGQVIPKDTSVCVQAVNGSKLIVTVLPQQETAVSTISE